MKFYRILYNFIEMILFVTASIYVTNEYIKNGSNLEIFFGLFLLLIFINQVIKTAEKDSKLKTTHKNTEEKVRK